MSWVTSARRLRRPISVAPVCLEMERRSSAGQFDCEICSKGRASAIVPGLPPAEAYCRFGHRCYCLTASGDNRGDHAWQGEVVFEREVTASSRMSRHGITTSPCRMFERRICRHREMMFSFNRRMRIAVCGHGEFSWSRGAWMVVVGTIA